VINLQNVNKVAETWLFTSNGRQGPAGKLNDRVKTKFLLLEKINCH
jgi:hypothetical protein